MYVPLTHYIILTLYKITKILPATKFLNKEISKLIPKFEIYLIARTKCNLRIPRLQQTLR